MTNQEPSPALRESWHQNPDHTDHSISRSIYPAQDAGFCTPNSSTSSLNSVSSPPPDNSEEDDCGVVEDDEEVPGTRYYVHDDDARAVLPDGSDAALKRCGSVVLCPQPSDSPNDPLNWRTARKSWHLLVIMMFTGFTAAISNITAGAQEHMNAEVGEYMDDIMTYANGVLFIGIGLMCYVLAPSAFLYGRRVAYLLCIVVAIIGSAMFGRLQGTTDAMWSQLMVGMAMGAAEAQVQLSITDIFFMHQQGLVVSLYVLTTALGTYLGPLVAGYIIDGSDAERARHGDAPLDSARRYVSGWRWIGWWAMAVAAVLCVVMAFGLEETYFDREKYYNRAKQLLMQQAASDGGSDVTLVEKQEEEESWPAKAAKHTQVSVESLEEGLGSDSEGEDAARFAPARAETCASMRTAVSRTNRVSRASMTGANEAPAPYLRRIAVVTPASNLRGAGLRQYARRLWLALRVFLFPPVIYAGLQWGAQNAWLSFYLNTMADVWSQEPYNYSSGAIGLMNLPCIIGALLGCTYGGILSDMFVVYVMRVNTERIEHQQRRQQERDDAQEQCQAVRRKLGGSTSTLNVISTISAKLKSRPLRTERPRGRHVICEPETRLWLLLPTAILSPLGMFLFGIGTVRHWHWLVSYLGLVFIGFGWGCAGDLSMSYLMDAYPRMVLEGMVGVSIVNNGIACIFTFFCQKWVVDQGNFRTYLAIGALDLVFFLVTIPMVWKGKWCRRKTKRLYEEFLQLRDGQNQ